MEGLYYREWTGHLSNIGASLRKCVGQYPRHYDDAKIGITDNPERRWLCHRNDGWGTMVVIYRSASRRYVENAERMVTRHLFEATTAGCEVWNMCNGGGGRKSDKKEQYLYLLLD